jgi:fatty acid hydroxylase family protein
MTVTWQGPVPRYRFLMRTFICHGPLAGGLALWGWPAAALPASAKTAMVVLGLLVWTLMEYLLHRFLLHARPQTPMLLAIVERLHLGHHRHPQDERLITVPVSASLPIASGLLGLFWLMTGSGPVAALLLTGSIAGYLYYETVHFRIHCGTDHGGWFSRRRARHLSHHFKDQRRWYGVTTQAWDLVLGTGRERA